MLTIKSKEISIFKTTSLYFNYKPISHVHNQNIRHKLKIKKRGSFTKNIAIKAFPFDLAWAPNIDQEVTSSIN